MSSPAEDLSSSTLKPIAEEKDEYSEVFKAFWAAYPRKVGKDAAFRAWKRKKTNLETVLPALEEQKKSHNWTKDGGQFIPNPQTWLNQGRWKDEVDTTPAPRAERTMAELEAMLGTGKGGEG